MDITDELMIASQYEKHGGRAHLMVHASEEIARLRAENERLKKWVEKAKNAMDDAIHTLQNTDEKGWVLGSIDLLNATLKSAPTAHHQTADE